jgi:hypothetical protein
VSTRRAERAYALLLRAYPAEFRVAYGREMMLAFRDLARDAGTTGFAFWIRIVTDVVRTAPALRAELARQRWNHNGRMERGPMKTMGILAVLTGLIQIANGIIELSAGGTAGTPGLVVGMFVVLGVLLSIAGVALLRRAAIAATLAQVAAVFWLVLAVVVRVVHPVMSIAAMLLAVVFPIALLLHLWITRGRRTRTGPA